MKHTIDWKRPLLLLMVARLLAVSVFVLSPTLSASAQDTEELTEQQMEVMRKYMKKAGLDDGQMSESESLIRENMERVAKQEADRKQQASISNGAHSEGDGMATISMQQKTYEMQVEKCFLSQDGRGDYKIEARGAPGQQRGRLAVSNDSHYNRVVIQLLTADGLWETYINPPLPDFDGRRFEWSGTVDGDAGPTQLDLKIVCEGSD